MSLANFAQVTTPLGDDVLRLRRMIGREELGRLFSYELELLGPDGELKLADLLGQPMTLHLTLADESVRYFNGIVSRFSRTGSSGRHAVYLATLRPWLWLLTRSTDCKIFQHMSVPDVITAVFRDHGLTDFDDSLTQSYEPWDYLVQYRESAFNFVSRLMEQTGIYYFFRHEDGKHTLVLADDYRAHESTAGYEEVPYYPPHSGEHRERDHLDGWVVAEEIQTGAYMLNDFDFTRPKASLQAKLKAPDPKTEFETYDYPGEYGDASDGEFYVRVRLEEQQAQAEEVNGHGNARGLAVGALFSLTGYPRDDQNREYLITAASYSLEVEEYETGSSESAGPDYRCSFSAIESRTPYRLPRITPKPTIVGPQTAMVVGKAGEEIWTDEYGRVKVQFHWDRLGEADENSSCWVRVAQVWAGARWGAMHIPRRRPRPPDHHRPRLQRRQHAALRAAVQPKSERPQEPQHQGRQPRQLQRAALRRQEG
jgi:type VI secretion system secreted protein VgrG